MNSITWKYRNQFIKWQIRIYKSFVDTFDWIGALIDSLFLGYKIITPKINRLTEGSHQIRISLRCIEWIIPQTSEIYDFHIEKIYWNRWIRVYSITSEEKTRDFSKNKHENNIYVYLFHSLKKDSMINTKCKWYYVLQCPTAGLTR